jgi:[ribosomal protein S18]-alanine N-acetyltransferase
VYILEPMTQEDVEEVSRVERRCFTNPWPVSAYRRELKNPRQNFYIVLRDDPEADASEAPVSSVAVLDGATLREARRPRRFAFWPLGHRSEKSVPPPIIGFAGMWNILDEAHVTTIGVLPEYRGRGLGELLFLEMIDEAVRRQSTWLTLEVRVTNYSAQALYRKYGFTIQGRRPRYYSDNNEDAFIMWSESFRDPEYLRRIEQHRRRLHHKMSFEPEPDFPPT